MDGENTSIYSDGSCHARSLSSSNHQSRDYVRWLAAKIGYLLPKSYRVCGENLYARHSIGYQGLPDYFLVFSVWDGETCLSWGDTAVWAEELGLQLVPVIYRGRYPEDQDPSLWNKEGSEGYVVRDAGPFLLSEFPFKVGKFVRENHVQTDSHWMHKAIVKNELAPKESG